MRMMLKRTKELMIRFCERCTRLYDDGCRRAALRERVLLQQVWRGLA